MFTASVADTDTLPDSESIFRKLQDLEVKKKIAAQTFDEQRVKEKDLVARELEVHKLKQEAHEVKSSFQEKLADFKKTESEVLSRHKGLETVLDEKEGRLKELAKQLSEKEQSINAREFALGLKDALVTRLHDENKALQEEAVKMRSHYEDRVTKLKAVMNGNL